MATTGRAIPMKLTELGRIRLGDREPNSKGNGTHPHKLEQFRLTSSNKPLLEYAARHPDIGGTVQEWQDAPGEGRQWELYTATESLDVIIPTFSAVSLSYERWSIAGCEQRCTGEFITHCARREELIGTECVCPADDQERSRQAQDGKACARILRLNVMLPDLPGTGFWRLDTKGFYATAELMGTLQLLKEAGAEHLMIEAVLRLEQRTAKRPGKGEGKGTLRFAVPVLWPKYTFRQIAAAREAQATLLLHESQNALPMSLAPAEHAAQATDALFGDGAGDVFRTSQHTPYLPRAGSEETQTPPDSPKETTDTPETIVGQSESSYGQMLPNSWRDTLEVHQGNPLLSDALRSKVKLALNPGSKTTDTKGFALASAVLDVLDEAKKRAGEGE